MLKTIEDSSTCSSSCSSSYPSCSKPHLLILRKKMGQPQTNCKRRYLNGFQRRNSSPITYRKCPKVPGRESGKKRDLLELTSIELQSSMKTRLNRMSNSSAHKNPLTLFRLGGGGGGLLMPAPTLIRSQFQTI